MTIQTMRDFGIGEGQIYIGGHWVDSASRERREIENPKDESIVALVPSSTIEDADRAVAAARKRKPQPSVSKGRDAGNRALPSGKLDESAR